MQSIGGKKYVLMIRDDFTRFNAVYFMRSKDEVSRYFRQYLADYRYTGVPCPVETVRTDDTAEFIRVGCLLIFARNGVSGKSSPLQTVRSVMV